MAEIAFGVVGVVGVAFQMSHATYTFLSSITGAPKSIKTLASHIESLNLFLETFNTVISKPEIRERAQNSTWLPSVVRALSCFEGVLNEVEVEVKRYLKYAQIH